MKVLETVLDLNRYLAPYHRAGKSIGLVPTMGSLHAGHLSLVATARADNDIVVMSIFVNPTQFAPGEDFEAYPRDLERDTELAAEAGVDAIFAPLTAELYPPGFSTFIDVVGVETSGMCAASRPGHFRGVTTVVDILLNLVRPARAYFGQKDAQQLAVIRRMASDLALVPEIVGCPIVREPDGLALSSRNAYLSPPERSAAPVLYQALRVARDAIESGQRSRDKIITMVEHHITAEPLAKLEYVEARNAAGQEAPSILTGEILLAVAARFGTSRLIDNIIVEIEET